MIRRFHEAKIFDTPSVTLWGSGTPRREFLHVDDLASACIFMLEEYDAEIPLNVGCGVDITINELARMVARITDFQGQIEWDTSRPDGTPQKLLDTSKINSLGWKPSIPLEIGIRETYEWFKSHLVNNADLRL